MNVIIDVGKTGEAKMKTKVMKREDVIGELIDDDLYVIENDKSYGENILYDGFCGYRKFTKKELLAEYNERINYKEFNIIITG